ncbi:MAG: aminotransferase class I/II-fold pyridoxal phosphate-dependent enzyme, partial [Cyanothece sp. SIO1E1]|nr:aminotransferase class I/II-fold pyridoxal phosphate-dependent enzyme [Cyanothece sp. SIO1E1]
MIQAASRMGEVKEYYFSRKLREIAQMRAEGKEILNLGIGSPDLPPSAGVIEELQEHSGKSTSHGYQGYTGIPELRKAFADWYQEWFDVSLNPNGEILPLIGSKEGIMHISMTYLEPGDEVLVPNPGYPAYRAVANLTGATIREYKLEESLGWTPDLDALSAQNLDKVKIMWVNYPNMPTGAQAQLEFYERLIRFAKEHQILVCNDNPYGFILNDKPVSILSVPGAKEVALELNSLSKSHNMAGWRVGMLGGAASYLSTILRFKSNMDSGMFRPLQLAAVKALQQPASWYQSVNSIYLDRRNRVYELLDLLDCVYDRNQVGMFVWAKIPAAYASGFKLSDAILYNAHVFITPGGIFGSQGDQYIRVSLCSETAVFEDAIRKIENAN